MITIDLTMPIHIINMLVLIVIMNVVLYRPIRSILIEREKKVGGLEKDITTFEKNAQLRLEEFDSKLAEARTNAKSDLEAVKSEAVGASSEKLAGIRKEAEIEKSEQLSKIKEHFTQAQSDLKGQLDNFAGDMANKILGRSLS